MINASKNNNFKQFFFSKFFVIFIILIIFAMIFGYFKSTVSMSSVDQEIVRLKEDLEMRKKRKIELLGLLNYVKSDRYVEEKARTELNLRKSGENVVILHGDTPVKDVVDYVTIPISGQKISNHIKWWYYFTNKNFNS